MKTHSNSITLPIKAAGDQVNFFNLKTRFCIGVIGRQYGKTTLAQYRAVVRIGTENIKNGVYWWISPTFTQARVVFKRFIRDYYSLIKPNGINRTFYEVTFLTGQTLAFKGSDKPDNLRGESLNGAILDECGQMKEEVWSEIIRPMMGTTNGWCDFIGTPKGKNWFYALYCRALAKEAGYSYHHASSDKSPYFSKEEFDKAKSEVPEKIFRQEYLAEFLDDDSEVFRGIKNCLSNTLAPPINGKTYVAGIDLAKSVDFTVITIWDAESKSMVYYDRFNQLDWNFQEMRIRAAIDKYDANIIIDSTGVGEPIYDRLRAFNYSIEPVKFTAQIKENLIHSLAMNIEKAEIRFPDIPELVSELQLFALDVSDSGKRKYSAPSGYHDDIVISMALAVSRLHKYANNFIFIGANGAR